VFAAPTAQVKACDIVTINCPLHPETERMFNAGLISKMKKGSYIVNTARGKIVDTDALVAAVKSGHIEGYAGDVWFPQPAPAAHPWRSMPRHAMTPHYSGTTLTVSTTHTTRRPGTHSPMRAVLTSFGAFCDLVVANRLRPVMLPV
jgi:formate dehydrogenase